MASGSLIGGDTAVATIVTAAANGIIPAQGGQSGKFLTTNGSNISWGSVGSGLTFANVSLSNLGITSINAALTFSGAGSLATVSRTGEGTDLLEIKTGDATNADAAYTGGIYLITGNAAGSGVTNTGPIALTTGGSAFGFSGDYSVQTGNVDSGGGPSGSLAIVSGNSSGVSGTLRLSSGEAIAGASGDIVLNIGPGLVDGFIKLQDTTMGTIGHVWTSTSTDGAGGWSAQQGASAGSISFRSFQSELNSAPNPTLLLSGSQSYIYQLNIATENVTSIASTSGGVFITTGQYVTASGSGGLGTGAIEIRSGSSNANPASNTTGAINIFSGTNTGGGRGAQSGRVRIESGGVTSSGDQSASGAVQILTGGASYQTGDLILGTGTGSLADISYSGAIQLYSGQVLGAAVSGNLQILSGATVHGTSGGISISTGGATGSGTSGNISVSPGVGYVNGTIQFQNSSEGVAGHVWTSTDAAGSGKWAGATTARYFASATGVTSSSTTVVWSTKSFDTDSAMSSGIYTVPRDGFYQVNCDLAVAGTIVLNNQVDLKLQRNNVTVSEDLRFAGGALTNFDVGVSDIIACSTGHTLVIQVSSNATGPSIVSSNTRNFISIARLGV